ncbi:CPBP family intramembrane glutamic endopeptidase [Antrihabitans cavernicola]|uniref:CPBP family intramembrane metalloprotease n=1 Tax=Antrihabitans cavernicola TaxID=2495913 RepID=A0A5A7SD86_9NOCA|nr:type II CAAX endopeptidase family protein [Spelaeibacter cavernicola]KAA0022455.1 CPBP family intramembrane metalloprotease [Spelaeibacter cavernicola]
MIRTQRPIWPAIGVYLLATFLVSGVLLVLQGVLGVDNEIISIVQFAPSVALLALIPLFRSGVPVNVGFGRARGVCARLSAVVAANVAMFGGCIALFAVLGDDVMVTRPADLAEPFLVILVFQFIGACGEELGWRCFLQPYLQTRYSLVVSAVLVGLMWGVWHIQYFAFGPLVVAGFLVSTVSMSLIMAALIERAPGGNLLIAGTFHWLINIGLLLLMNEEDGKALPMIVFAVMCAAVAAVTLAVRRSSVTLTRTGGLSRTFG